jgi:hypothetical protein
MNMYLNLRYPDVVLGIQRIDGNTDDDPLLYRDLRADTKALAGLNKGEKQFTEEDLYYHLQDQGSYEIPKKAMSYVDSLTRL